MTFVRGITDAIAVFLVGIAIAIPLGYYGPQVEANILPIYADVTASALGSDSHDTLYKIRFDKIRECEPRWDLAGWYATLSDGTIERVAITSLDGSPVSPPNTARPIGRGEFIWSVANRELGQITSQTLILYHECHPLWKSKTVINIPGSIL